MERKKTSFMRLKRSNLGDDVLVFSKMGLTVFATVDLPLQIHHKNPTHLDFQTTKTHLE